MTLSAASAALGLVVLIGVPVLVLLLGLVIKPLQARQLEQREEVGKLTALGADTASGLRVLRGIGGEAASHLKPGVRRSRSLDEAFDRALDRLRRTAGLERIVRS